MSTSSRCKLKPDDLVRVKGTTWHGMSGRVVEVSGQTQSWISLTVRVAVEVPGEGLDYHYEKYWFSPRELEKE